MSQKYSPSIPPQEEEELLPFLNEEFVRVGQTLNDLADGYWGVSMETPKKLKPGTVKYFAPGVVGPVSGIYHYDLDNQWRLAGTKPKDLPGDFILFTPQNNHQPMGTCAYRMNTAKDEVWITMLMSGGNYTNGATVLDLPQAYWPPAELFIPAYSSIIPAQSTITYPPPSDPNAPPLDQVFDVLNRATIQTGVVNQAMFKITANGRVLIQGIPQGAVFGGTFTFPLVVTP
ncbi:hypothetical protein FJK_gp57c [Pseudomonas phage FJK]|nr:hypothetical protein FJK_gp57c [Pseudomonas phage FJK]